MNVKVFSMVKNTYLNVVQSNWVWTLHWTMNRAVVCKLVWMYITIWKRWLGKF